MLSGTNKVIRTSLFRTKLPLRGLRGLSTAEKKGFVYQELFDLKTTPDTTTKYRKLFDGQYVSTIELDGRKFLKIDPEGLRKLSQQAMIDIAHLYFVLHIWNS